MYQVSRFLASYENDVEQEQRQTSVTVLNLSHYSAIHKVFSLDHIGSDFNLPNDKSSSEKSFNHGRKSSGKNLSVESARRVVIKVYRALILFGKIVGNVVCLIFVGGSVLPGSSRAANIKAHLFVSFGMNQL
jgi:hypothetical protein